MCSRVHGDVPESMRLPPPLEAAVNQVIFNIVVYNIHSCMNFDDRFERVLFELGTRRWDALIFTETWREEKRDIFNTSGGHKWFGSGGLRGRSGVGILLHQRWSYQTFNAMSDRCATLYLVVQGMPLDICAVYMPHSDRPDAEVEAVYAEIESILCRRKRAECRTIVA